MKKFGILLLVSLFFSSCEKTLDFYLGIYEQPEFTEEGSTEGLNIFGVLRPDFRGEYNQSFVFVQKLWSATDWLEGFEILEEAEIVVYTYSHDRIIDTTRFLLMNPDTHLFSDTLYRPLYQFAPEPGVKYELVCSYPGLETARGYLFFPDKPVIRENSVSIEGSSVKFTVGSDTLIKMIDIYIDDGVSRMMLDRVLLSDSTDTDITAELPADPSGFRILIFGYDANLAVYYGNSNTSLNFNKYRTGFTTLETGYGVFGALNFTEVILPLAD
jgi:hypothetical protein